MITQERLNELLSYNENTGLFTWIKNKGRAKAGSVAGSIQNGYTAIIIDGRQYRAHRLAWLYVYGKWPKEELDHINIKGDDNRILNLREADKFQNKANCLIRKDNRSGFKGVGWNKASKKWRARISINNERKDLGAFDTPEEASKAYIEAADKYHREFACY